jgi:SulP family sulfate permease
MASAVLVGVNPVHGLYASFAGPVEALLRQLATIWRTGRLSQIAMAATFAATLFMPVAAAVGVTLSLLLQLNQEAVDLTVVELVPTDDHQFRQQSAPRPPWPATR